MHIIANITHTLVILGSIGMFPCQKGIQTRKAVIKEILDCEYGLLECSLLRDAGKEKWPEKEGKTFLKIWSGQRLDEEEKDGPYRVYGAAGVQGSARTATMKEEQAILIDRPRGKLLRSGLQGLDERFCL